MDQKIADLTSEQQQKLSKMESEIGCVLVAYQTKNQAHKTGVK